MFEEYGLETIEAWGLVRLHTKDGLSNLLFKHMIGKGAPAKITQTGNVRNM